jgi:hypothetical protein
MVSIEAEAMQVVRKNNDPAPSRSVTRIAGSETNFREQIIEKSAVEKRFEKEYSKIWETLFGINEAWKEKLKREIKENLEKLQLDNDNDSPLHIKDYISIYSLVVDPKDPNQSQQRKFHADGEDGFEDDSLEELEVHRTKGAIIKTLLRSKRFSFPEGPSDSNESFPVAILSIP